MSKPFYILAAVPMQSVQLKSFFEQGEGSVMTLLQNPEKLRNMGWDLQTLDIPRIIKGEYLEVRSGERKLLNLYEDGTFIMRAVADYTFLGHGQGEEAFKKKPRLNPLAIIEVTYNFINFYKKLISHFEVKPTTIKFKTELKNTYLEEDKKLYLNPGGVKDFDWPFDDDPHKAPEEHMANKEIIKATDDLLDLSPYVAYELIEKLYLWFGFNPNKIPYTSLGKHQKRFIDEGKIITL